MFKTIKKLALVSALTLMAGCGGGGGGGASSLAPVSYPANISFLSSVSY